MPRTLAYTYVIGYSTVTLTRLFATGTSYVYTANLAFKHPFRYMSIYMPLKLNVWNKMFPGVLGLNISRFLNASVSKHFIMRSVCNSVKSREPPIYRNFNVCSATYC